MTIVNTCTHERSGIKYQATVPMIVARDFKGRIMGTAWDNKGRCGVLITLPCGTKIWRPNEYYQ
jgi:hypothetical protein